MRAFVGICLLLAGMGVCGDSTTVGKLCARLQEAASAGARSAYAALRQARLQTQLQYYTLHRDALAGLPRIDAGKPLGNSACSPRVLNLRRHLFAQGFLTQSVSGTATCMDEAARDGVYDYQVSRDLQPDRVAGPLTLATMNVPVDRRIQNIQSELALLSSYDTDPVARNRAQHSAKSAEEIQLLKIEMESIIANPTRHSFGELARAHAIMQRINHRLAIANSPRQCGLFHGRRLRNQPSGTSRMDCTIQGVNVLNAVHRQLGTYDTWRALLNEAVDISNRRARRQTPPLPDGIRVTVLMEVLQQKAGWRGILWGPDTRTPWDGDPEHIHAIAGSMRTATYYGVNVDPDEAVLDYGPAHPEILEQRLYKSKQVLDRRLECKAGYPDRWRDTTATAQTEGLERLRKIPFGVIAARGGKHVALILDGVVYEAHSRSPCTDPELVEVTDLACWWWNSGVILVPPS